MLNKEIYNKWTEFINDDKYKKYFIDNETEWINKLDLVKKYIDENNVRPNSNDNNNDIKELGHWCIRQVMIYKKKEQIMENEYIYNKWTEFINDNKYKIFFEDFITVWLNKLEELKKYIDKNNKRPSSESNDNETKVLGIWILNNKNNLKNKKNNMIYDIIYNKWIEFINDNKI
jgi:hypothetical protein